MSDRTDKAHAALADAMDEYRRDSRRSLHLMDIANTQAQIAQAEALESIATSLEKLANPVMPGTVKRFAKDLGYDA